MRTLLRTLVAVAACAGLSGCGDAARLGTGPGHPQSDLIGWATEAAGLVPCSPLPADSVTQTVGPSGGTIGVGPHVLVIPPGALAAPVAITAVAPSDLVNHVRFGPEGLAFHRPAMLRMSYANCHALQIRAPQRIAYTTDGLDIISYLPSLDAVGTVAGRLEHFSTYAVAW